MRLVFSLNELFLMKAVLKFKQLLDLLLFLHDTRILLINLLVIHEH